jgi:3-oxoacyl-[acyl-carrier protein] reductase
MRLKSKVALVTGSSRGIGRSIALAFAREGANVVVNYLKSEEKARHVVSEIESFGRKAIALRADVSKISEVQRMVNECVKQFGRLDILVNNAADFSVMEFSLENPDWQSWERMVDVNVKGILICSQVASRYMLKQGSGVIINIVADCARGRSVSIIVTKWLSLNRQAARRTSNAYLRAREF